MHSLTDKALLEIALKGTQNPIECADGLILQVCLKDISGRLRPAGGVNHPASVLAKVGKLPAKRALR